MVRCPLCGNDNQRLIHGVEIRGVYDGTLFWHCVVCGTDWPRFDLPSRLHHVAKDIIDQWAELENEKGQQP